MPPPPEGPHARRRLGRIALTLALAWAAALLCQALHVPLPWMLGPLFASAVLGMAGVPVLASGRLRNAGQWVIGIALGLYFTPAVLALIIELAPMLVAGVAWALALGYGFYRLLLRSNGGDRATAFFAAAIGGASEMAVLAESRGGRVDRVAAAHSMRLLLVVTIIPFGFQALGLHGVDLQPPAVTELRPLGLLVLAAASLVGVALLRRVGAPNPWVLGALAVTLALTASGVALSALPAAASQAGQLFIGVALGTRFTPAFVRAAPRWLGSVALGTLVMMAASAVFAGLLSRIAGLHPATALLATAPGGIAEMAITAKVLQLGVPVVTAFQVVRYVSVLTLTPVLFRWEQRRAG
jgi:membrane AbrB-like protein